MALTKNQKNAALGLAVLVGVGYLTANDPGYSPSSSSSHAGAACSPAKFEIIDKTASVEKFATTITAVVRNNNATACGFRLSTDLLDKDGRIVANNRGWPASINNIAPGATYSFNVMFLDENRHRADNGSFRLDPIEARAW